MAEVRNFNQKNYDRVNVYGLIPFLSIKGVFDDKNSEKQCLRQMPQYTFY